MEKGGKSKRKGRWCGRSWKGASSLLSESGRRSLGRLVIRSEWEKRGEKVFRFSVFVCSCCKRPCKCFLCLNDGHAEGGSFLRRGAGCKMQSCAGSICSATATADRYHAQRLSVSIFGSWLLQF
jgi:hypothetical protein